MTDFVEPIRRLAVAEAGPRGTLPAEPRGGAGCQSTASVGLLVLNAKFVSARDRSAILAGALAGAPGGAERAQLVRLLRWQRQSVARSLLPDSAVAKCYRVMRQRFVEVNYSARVRRAHYAGLVTCASVWDCPVCSAKITERRRVEIENADTRGLTAFMVTFTFQHSRDDTLRALRDYLSWSYRKLKMCRAWSRFAASWQIVASVAGTEITYGLANGWHPHKHVLFWSRLASSAIDTGAIQRELADRFGSILAKRGRYSHATFGVDVRAAGNLVADYVAKFGHEPKEQSWSLAAELTKGGNKSRLRMAEHYTPFQLLDLCLAGDGQAGTLFREYASAMFGSKQLVWSRGARELLGLGVVEASDAELAAAQEQDADLFALLTAGDWKIILQRGLRGHLLEVASRHDLREFTMWLHANGADGRTVSGSRQPVTNDGLLQVAREV